MAFLETAGVVAPGATVTSSDYGSSDWSNITFAQNQWGITSRQQLLDASPEVQTEIENAGLSSTWTQLGADGAQNFIGQTAPGGQVINQSALIACGEQLGAAGCDSFLTTGTTGNPTLDTGVEQEMESMSQTNFERDHRPDDNLSFRGGGRADGGWGKWRPNFHVLPPDRLEGDADCCHRQREPGRDGCLHSYNRLLTRGWLFGLGR